MLLAAIDSAHGHALLAATDPAQRLLIARNAVARSPLPVLPLTDPVTANLLMIFLCAHDPDLATALAGHPIAGADLDFPLHAVTPSQAAELASRLATLATTELDRYLAHFAADPPPAEQDRRTVRQHFTQLRDLYRAAADRHLGLLALPE